MKSRTLFTLIFLSILKIVNGQVADTTKTKKIFKLPKSETSLSLTFRFPVGDFGADFRPTTSSTGGILETIEGTSGGMSADMGYEAGLTSNFFFDKKPSNFNTGLRITYLSFSTIPFSWETSGDYIWNEGEFKNLNFLSVKAGIVFRKAVAENKAFYFYDQVCLTYCYNGGMSYDESYNMNAYTRVSDQAELVLNSGTGLRNEMGVSFRTGHFVTEFGYSFGNINFDEAEFTRSLSAPGYEPLHIDVDIQPRMPTGTVNLSVGLKF